MSYQYDLQAKINEIKDDLKKDKVFIVKLGNCVKTIVWDDIVSVVVDDIDDKLHALIFDNDNSQLFIAIEEILNEQAYELAEDILAYEFRMAEEANELNYDNSL